MKEANAAHERLKNARKIADQHEAEVRSGLRPPDIARSCALADQVVAACAELEAATVRKGLVRWVKM